jgi:hypothetical protein
LQKVLGQKKAKDKERIVDAGELCADLTIALLHNVSTQGDQIGRIFGHLFSLGKFWKITEVAQVFGLIFYTFFDKKMCWAASWAKFSQTRHPAGFGHRVKLV